MNIFFFFLALAQYTGPSILQSYQTDTVPRVCQHQGCDFDKKCKRKGMCFGQKCKRKGVFWVREWITQRQFSKVFGATRHFSAVLFRKGYNPNGNLWGPKMVFSCLQYQNLDPDLNTWFHYFIFLIIAPLYRLWSVTHFPSGQKWF